MSLVLQQTLRGLCHNTLWSYAVFWKLKERAKIVLTWEDGFYDYAKRSRTSSGEEDEVDTELLGLAVAKMSYHVYSYGEGIIGKIAFSGKYQWVFMGASVSTDEKHPVGWENQFMAGIKTIALIAVPQGVVQLGSTRVVQEDVALVNHVRGLFTSLRSVPGVFLSDLMTESPKGGHVNPSAFQTAHQSAQWASPAQTPPSGYPSGSLTPPPLPEGPVSASGVPNYSPYYAGFAQTGPLAQGQPVQSPRGAPFARHPYPPLAPRGPWGTPGSHLGGYYTQVTPQLVAEGSPYGVPHPYGVPLSAPPFIHPTTPSDTRSQGGFSAGGPAKSQRKGRRGGGETASSGGSQGVGERAGSEARSGDSMQVRMQRQLSSGRKSSPGMDMNVMGETSETRQEGGAVTPGGVPPQREQLHQLSPQEESAPSPLISGGIPMQMRSSNTYLRHSAGALPERYQAFPMAPQMGGQVVGSVSPPSRRLSLLAPKPIQVQQTRAVFLSGDITGQARNPLVKSLGEKPTSPMGDTGCSTVSNVQLEQFRPQLDTQSEGASTAGPLPTNLQTNFSGGASSSLSTQLSAPPRGLSNLGNLRVSTGLSKMLSEGQKPTMKSVEAYRLQQQAQLESLERAGLKGTEVYNMWEEIMEENYRVGVALASLEGGEACVDAFPPEVHGPPVVASPSPVPAVNPAHVVLERQGSGLLQGSPRGGAVPAVSETPLVSCGATEQINTMQLSSGSRSPELLEAKSDQPLPPEPLNPEGVPAGLEEGVALPVSLAGGLSSRANLTGAETMLELAAMYTHGDPSGAADLSTGIIRGSSLGLSRMMPTPGLSPSFHPDLDLPASETPSPTIDPAVTHPAELFKPRSSPPVPLFSSERSLLAPLPSPRVASPGGSQLSRRNAMPVPLFGNEPIASLPTSSVWAIALKGSGEAAARRRAFFQGPAEQSMSHQGSAATQAMSCSLQGCTSSDVRVTALPGGGDDSIAGSARSGSPELGYDITVMSAGGVLESRGVLSSPRRLLEHAVSAPVGWEAQTASDGGSERSKRKSEIEAPETSEGAGESSRGTGRKRGKARGATTEGDMSLELTATGRPKPKDRQQIQRRLAELRGVIPDTGKLPIDGLLERTIKHLAFLRSVKSEKPVRREIQLPAPLRPLDMPGGIDTKTVLSPGSRKRQSARPSVSQQNPEVNPRRGALRPAYSEASALNPPRLASLNPGLGQGQFPTKTHQQQGFLEALNASHLDLDTWQRQHVAELGPSGQGVGFGIRPNLGGLGRVNPRPNSMEQLLSGPYQEPIVVEILKDPRHVLIEALCKNESFFAELSGFLHGLGLQIRRSVLQAGPTGQQWARFVVEASKPADRFEIALSLRRFIDSRTSGTDVSQEPRAGEVGGSGTQLNLLPPLDVDFGTHYPNTHWQGLEGVLEHDLNMYLEDPY